MIRSSASGRKPPLQSAVLVWATHLQVMQKYLGLYRLTYTGYIKQIIILLPRLIFHIWVKDDWSDLLQDFHRIPASNGPRPREERRADYDMDQNIFFKS